MDNGIYTRIQTLIEEGDISEAQKIIEETGDRDAQWHYLRCRVFLVKNWTNEARKQLEIALNLDPDNEQYRQELENFDRIAKEIPKLEQQKIEKKDMSDPASQQLGSSCAECCCGSICGGVGGD